MGIWFHSLNCLLNITQLLLITFLISCTSNFTPTRVKRPNKWWNHFWAMTIVTHTECNQPQDVDIKTIESVVTYYVHKMMPMVQFWISHVVYFLDTPLLFSVTHKLLHTAEWVYKLPNHFLTLPFPFSLLLLMDLYHIKE